MALFKGSSSRGDTVTRIEVTWIEGASVQLRNVGRSARLCLSAQTRALRNEGSGHSSLFNGP